MIQLAHKNLIMNYLKTIIKVLITLVFFYSVLYTVSEFVGPDFNKGEYLMEYKVYYPNNPKTYTIKNDWPIEVGSRHGTNYIVKIKQIYNFNLYRSETVFETSAPIKIMRYTYIKN